jgi:uncharacterized damage-inducible protein DinB
MNMQIKRYSKELNRLFGGNNWLGVNIMSSLKGIDAEKAFYKPKGWAHSIAEIVCHLLEYRIALINRIDGMPVTKVNQKKSFDTSKYGSVKYLAWQKILKSLKDIQKKLIEVLSQKDDSFLEGIVWQKNTGHFYISAIIQHDIYHMGQFALMKNYLKKNFKKRKQ